MKSIKDSKIYYPETIPDIELPDIIMWENLIDAPRTLAELSHVDGERLDTVETNVISGFGDIAIQGWSNNMTFSASNHNTVAWTSGVIRFKDGTSYNISSGNTGTMSAVTYIYLDLAVSTTALQVTTNSANAVGVNKLLVGVAQNVASGKNAVFQMFGGAGGIGVLLTANNIAANSITANEIQTNTITTLDLTAGSISGMTITGGTIRTSSTGARIELDGTADEIIIYDSGNVERAIGHNSGWDYYNPSGQIVASIFAGTTTLGTRSLLLSTQHSSGNIYINAGSSGYATLGVNSSIYMYAGAGELSFAVDLMPIGSLQLGDLGSEWNEIWVDTVITGEILTDGGAIDVGGTLNITSGFDLELEDGIIEITEGFMNLAQMTGSLATSKAGVRDGSMYYRTNDNVIRVRLNGTWRTITTS